MIQIIKTKTPKPLPPNEAELGFGQNFTDHMYICEYDKGVGWHNARIVPFGDISLSPAAMVFHYSQTIFEGLKAYRAADRRVLLFRPQENCSRLNVSAKRLVIPEIPVADSLAAIKTLVSTDERWIPSSEGTSLYIRPFIIAADPFVGVRPSNRYLFMIILSPSGPYYKEGLAPVSLMVETKYVRAVRGGLGYTKTGANYAASLLAQDEAHEKGYSQVLWLDAIEGKYIEEVGSMNIFFVIERDGEDVIITPALSGSVLPGITRKSVIELAKNKFNMQVFEEKISIDDILTDYKNGKLKEVFGTGTAAVISPVGSLDLGSEKIIVNNNQIGEVAGKMYETLTGIQYGKLPDDMNWTMQVKI